MYGWLWRALPGSASAKVVQLTAIAVIAFAVLWFWAFPWASGTLPVGSFAP